MIYLHILQTSFKYFPYFFFISLRTQHFFELKMHLNSCAYIHQVFAILRLNHMYSYCPHRLIICPHRTTTHAERNVKFLLIPYLKLIMTTLTHRHTHTHTQVVQNYNKNNCHPIKQKK